MGLRKLGDNLYLYPGSPGTLIKVIDGNAILVDPGHGSGRHKDLKRELRKIGATPRAQLATHGHADHVSTASRMGAPLYTHRFEFSIAGSPLNREILTFGSKAPRGFLVYQFPEEVKVQGIFEWNDVLFGLKTIRLDGHSPGMTGFLDEENGVIYVGDAFFGEKVINSVGVPYFVEPSLFKNSIMELINYVKTGYLLVPSHGPIVKEDDAEKLLRFNLDRVVSMEELVVEFLEKPMGIEELAYRLMLHYGVDVTPVKLALNLVPLRATIADLYNRGVLEVTVENGLKWRTVRG